MNSQLNPYPDLIDSETLTAVSAAQLGRRITNRDEKLLIEYILRASRQLGILPVRLLTVLLYFTTVLIVMVRTHDLKWNDDARQMFALLKREAGASNETT